MVCVCEPYEGVYAFRGRSVSSRVSHTKGRVAASSAGSVGRLQSLLVVTDGGAGAAIEDNGRTLALQGSGQLL